MGKERKNKKTRTPILRIAPKSGRYPLLPRPLTRHSQGPPASVKGGGGDELTCSEGT